MHAPKPPHLTTPRRSRVSGAEYVLHVTARDGRTYCGRDAATVNCLLPEVAGRQLHDPLDDELCRVCKRRALAELTPNSARMAARARAESLGHRLTPWGGPGAARAVCTQCGAEVVVRGSVATGRAVSSRCDFRFSKAPAPAHEPNSGGYYVWIVQGDEPLPEGPYGPHDLVSAEAFARIGAIHGEHDRVVTHGIAPTAQSFVIARRYEAGTGRRVL